MSLPTASSGTSFSTATTVSAWVEYPFRDVGDPDTKIYHHIMKQALDDYAPLDDDDTMTAATQKPVRSPFDDDANAFYIGDSPATPIDGGLVEFDRMFSNIPADRVEGAGLYASTFPSNDSNAATFAINTNLNNTDSGKSTEPDRPELSFLVTTAEAANIEIGDFFIAGYGGSTNACFTVRWLGDPGSEILMPKMIVYYKEVEGGSVRIKAYLETYEAVDYSRTVAAGIYGYKWTTGPSNLYAIFQKAIGRANSFTENSESFITYRFVKTDNINDEKFEAKFNPLQYINSAPDSDDGFTVVDALTASTVPTALEYNGMVFAQAKINAEPEVAARWRGNIWQIIGRKVVAK